MTDHPAAPSTAAPMPGLPPARISSAGPRGRAARSPLRKRVTAIAIIGAIMLGIACWGALAATQRGADGQRFSTVAVTRGSVVQRLNGTGTVAKVNEMSVRFPASGKVLEVPVAVGDTVAAGDVLAVLDDTALRTKVLQAQADVDAATLSLAQIKEAEREASRPSNPGGSGSSGGPGGSGGGDGGGGGVPAPELPPAPEVGVDLTDVEETLSNSDAALTLVVERQRAADEAFAAMAQVCAIPTPTPTPDSTATPSPTPEPSPTPAPSTSPTPDPSGTPSLDPDPSPTPDSTATDTPEPAPSEEPSPTPTAEPKPTASATATPEPAPSTSATPSASPSTPAEPVDPVACQEALAKSGAAQASLAEAQTKLNEANGHGLNSLRAAQAAVVKAVEDLGAWLAMVGAMLDSLLQPGQPLTPTPPADPPIDQPSGGGDGLGQSGRTSAEVALARAKRALVSAQDDMVAATMRAPMAGIVTELPFTVGDQASETDRAVVTAPGAVRVTIHVPASAFLYLSPGQQATLRAPGGVEAQARVASKALIPSENGYPVTLVTSETGTDGFSAGMTASVSIEVSSATDVVIAPLSAVTRSGGPGVGQSEGTVRLLRGEEPEDVSVQLGSIGDTHVQILGGVSEGDRLVVADATLPLPSLDFSR